MKAALLSAFGRPADVTRCVDVPELNRPGHEELTVAIEASPINPSDLLYITGGHFQRASLPLIPGGEAVGRVVGKGRNVAMFEIGDRVVLLTSGNWVQTRNVKASDVMRVPALGSPQQFAALRVNPATAYALCNLVRDLRAGDWVIQNAANSAVGALFSRFAKEKGVRTINVVRRHDAVASVLGRGGDIVLVDGEDLAERVRDAVPSAAIMYGIDAIGGRATLNLARCLVQGGFLIVYGMLGGEPCAIQPSDLISKELTLSGFRLKNFFDRRPPEVLQEVYARLADRLARGETLTEFEAEYPLEKIGQALEHAQRSRKGKILLAIGQPQPGTAIPIS
jgi:NADPH:quinone reductase-like Zn-dependent oxidoreductase